MVDVFRITPINHGTIPGLCWDSDLWIWVIMFSVIRQAIPLIVVLVKWLTIWVIDILRTRYVSPLLCHSRTVYGSQISLWDNLKSMPKFLTNHLFSFFFFPQHDNFSLQFFYQLDCFNIILVTFVLLQFSFQCLIDYIVLLYLVAKLLVHLLYLSLLSFYFLLQLVIFHCSSDTTYFTLMLL